MQIRRTSIISGIERVRDIPVDPNDMMLYQLEMGSIQELMPYLTDDDREFIMTGITSEEWQQAFSEEA
jgi:hypothetical protein